MVTGLKVISPGSNPDVDSDINTVHRPEVVEYITEVYGEDAVANIITFGTLAARGAFKAMCNIYEIPYAQANKIASLVPAPVEGVECTINDIFDETSDRYKEGAEFRDATSGPEWEKVINGARNIEGKNRNSGVHACGIIISSKPLVDSIPLHVRQSDGRVITQWTYKECESLGLIKMDLLGLDTVDLVQHTVTYIMKNGKKAPNMTELIHGPMDDPKVYELFQKGQTEGIFQFRSEMVRDLLLSVRPTTFDDLAATTAVARPGPMGMMSHTKYADRKNGREEIDFIHKEFEGSPLEDILKDTYGLCVPAGTRILNATTGVYVPIETVTAGETLTPSVNLTTGKLENKTINHLIKTGVRNIVKISINGGRTLRVSDTHPVLTDKGYKPAGELQAFDKIAVSTQETLNIPTHNLNNVDAYNLGVSIAQNHSGKSDFNIDSLFSPYRITSEIMESSNESLKNLIAGLWDTTHAKTVGNTMSISLNSNSLRKEIAHVLVRLGLDYSLSENTVTIANKGRQIAYSIEVNVTELHKVVGAFSKSYDNSVNDVPAETTVDNLSTSFDDVTTFRSVTNVEFDGAEMCYDIEVADNHNFVVDGFVVSNCIYQEQIIKIASEIAGMTLQEGDDLRSAMGKKQVAVMASMKPKFFEGAMNNGYSEEAINVLWSTVDEFAKYGFNKAHSYAYAMSSYKSAYLKVHYPVEFMAALIAQNIGDREKTTAYIQEAKTMGINVGTVDINLSDIRVAPDYSKKSGHEILFGLSGVKSVSETMATVIIKERDANGDYKSVQDLIERCSSLGVANRRIYENLALAGAFDLIEPNRKAVVDSIANMMGEAKKKNAFGLSLFDMFEIEEESQIVDVEDYSFSDRLKHEADMVGLYLSAHPLDKVERGIGNTITIDKVLKSQRRITVNIIASVVEITSKTTRRGKSVMLNLDDGSGFMNARLSPMVLKSIAKFEAQESIRKGYEKGYTEVQQDIAKRAVDPQVMAKPDVEKNSIYFMTLTYTPAREHDTYNARVDFISPLKLSYNGTLPIRIRLKITDENIQKMRNLYKKLPPTLSKREVGSHSIMLASYRSLDLSVFAAKDNMYRQAIYEMTSPNFKSKEQTTDVTKVKSNTVKASKDKSDSDLTPRIWPPEKGNWDTAHEYTSEANLVDIVESLEYRDSGFTTSKNQATSQFIAKYLGYESYDYGIFNANVMDID